jgi:hypothetical protein
LCPFLGGHEFGAPHGLHPWRPPPRTKPRTSPRSVRRSSPTSRPSPPVGLTASLDPPARSWRAPADMTSELPRANEHQKTNTAPLDTDPLHQRCRFHVKTQLLRAQPHVHHGACGAGVVQLDWPLVQRWDIYGLYKGFRVTTPPSVPTSRSDVLRSIVHGSMDEQRALSRSFLNTVQERRPTMTLLTFRMLGQAGVRVLRRGRGLKSGAGCAVGAEPSPAPVLCRTRRRWA